MSRQVPDNSRSSDPAATTAGKEAVSPRSVFETWPYVDRRDGDDRRYRPTRVWGSLLRYGRRHKGRRRGESENIYVDVYARRDVVAVVVILLLNILDAYFTLDYLGKGGREANPVADNLLKMGDEYFVYAKCLLVALCLIFLLVHKTFRYVRVAIGFLLFFYGALLIYHIYLQVTWHMHHG